MGQDAFNRITAITFSTFFNHIGNLII